MSIDPSIFPEISDAEIERRATELLWDYYDKSGRPEQFPVPVEVIAEQHLGYDIDIVDDGLFSDPDYLGGIIFDRAVIQVNAAVEAHEGRYNFTLAHEIGHHVLHRERYLAARDGEPCDILCRETGEKPLIEAQADRFAAALLMPAAAVTRVVQEYPFRRVTSAAGLRAMAAKVIQRGGFTNVSNTAMANRLSTSVMRERPSTRQARSMTSPGDPGIGSGAPCRGVYRTRSGASIAASAVAGSVPAAPGIADPSSPRALPSPR